MGSEDEKTIVVKVKISDTVPLDLYREVQYSNRRLQKENQHLKADLAKQEKILQHITEDKRYEPTEPFDVYDPRTS